MNGNESEMKQSDPPKKYIPLPSPIIDTPSKTYSITEETFQKDIAKYLAELFVYGSDKSPERSEGEHTPVAAGKENIPVIENLENEGDNVLSEKTWFEKYMWKINPRLYQGYVEYKNNSKNYNLSIDTNNMKDFTGIKSQFKNILKVLYFYYSFGLFILIQILMIVPNILYDLITEYSYQLTKYLTTEKGSSDDSIRKDSKILVNILYCIFTYPIVVFVTYNWYFLTSYYEKIENKEIRPARDENRPKILFYDGYGIIFKSILKFLFDPALKPLEIIDRFFFGDAPICMPYFLKLVKYDFEISLNNIKRLVVSIISVFIVYYFGLFTTIDELVNGESNFTVYLSATIVALFQIAIFYNYFMPPVFSANVDRVEIETNLKKYSFKVINPLIFIFVTLLYIGVLIAQTILVTHPATIMCVIYIWINSIFGISLYGGGIPFTKAWNAYIKLMEEEFDKDVNTFYKDDGCIEPGFFKVLLRTFVKIIRCNLNVIILMVVIFSLFIDSFLNLNSQSFKFYICMGLAVFFLSLIPKFIYDLYKDFDRKEYNPEDPVCKTNDSQNGEYGDERPDLY
jgi:hypothetical protein